MDQLNDEYAITLGLINTETDERLPAEHLGYLLEAGFIEASPVGGEEKYHFKLTAKGMGILYPERSSGTDSGEGLG